MRNERANGGDNGAQPTSETHRSHGEADATELGARDGGLFGFPIARVLGEIRQAFKRRHPVQEQYAVEMIRFMLDDTSRKA